MSRKKPNPDRLVQPSKQQNIQDEVEKTWEENMWEAVFQSPSLGKEEKITWSPLTLQTIVEEEVKKERGTPSPEAPDTPPHFNAQVKRKCHSIVHNGPQGGCRWFARDGQGLTPPVSPGAQVYPGPPTFHLKPLDLCSSSSEDRKGADLIGKGVYDHGNAIGPFGGSTSSPDVEIMEKRSFSKLSSPDIEIMEKGSVPKLKTKYETMIDLESSRSSSDDGRKNWPSDGCGKKKRKPTTKNHAESP